MGFKHLGQIPAGSQHPFLHVGSRALGLRFRGESSGVAGLRSQRLGD